jgi:hypothetical protein
MRVRIRVSIWGSVETEVEAKDEADIRRKADEFCANATADEIAAGVHLDEWDYEIIDEERYGE